MLVYNTTLIVLSVFSRLSEFELGSFKSFNRQFKLVELLNHLTS